MNKGARTIMQGRFFTRIWCSSVLLCFSLGSVWKADAGIPQLNNFRNFARRSYPRYAAALDRCGYWGHLETVMKSYSVTVLIPNNPTLPQEFRRRSPTFARQIYGLHVVIGIRSAASFTGSAKGTGFLTAGLFPPAPEPGMYMWRVLNSGSALFNGSKDARGGARFVRRDVYSDGSRVRAHVVDRTMLPYKFFVTSEDNQVPKFTDIDRW